MPPPPSVAEFAADGAVGQRGRAAVVIHAAAGSIKAEAEFPLTVQLVNVARPRVRYAAAAVSRLCRSFR